MVRITPLRIALAACCLLLLIVVVWQGCSGESGYDQWGGMSKEEWLAQKKQRDQQQKAAEADNQKAASKKSSPKSEKKPRAARRPSRREKPTARIAKPPAIPKDFADWKPEDYCTARKNGERQLSDALAYLGKQHPDKKRAVEILLTLLVDTSLDAETNPSRRTKMGDASKTVEAIVAALADNDTPAAWRAIEQLALGELKTADNQAAALAAVKMLIERPRPENEDSLLRAVTSAARPPAADDAAEEAQETRKKMLALVKSSSSASFRIRLADAIASPQTPRSLFDELWPCLQDPRPENLIPHVILYQSERPDLAVRTTMEQRFAAASGPLLARLLGIPASTERQSNPDTAPRPEDDRAFAERLWSRGFATALEQRLLAIEALEKSGKLLLLAGSIPNSRIRAALHRSMDLHWEEGPKALESAGFGKDALPEPGFLVAVKMLPRKNPPAGANTAARRTSNTRGPSSKASALFEARRRRDEIAQAWMGFSAEMTQEMCRQFRAASFTRARSGRGNLDAGNFPLKPHPNAEVVAAYKLSWPEELKDGANEPLSLSPLRIHYLRIEQRAKFSGVLGYYRRQLSNREEHSLPQGTWLDALDERSHKPLVRSTDVLITTPNDDRPGRLDQEQRLIIEILTVECPEIAARTPAVTGG